MASIVLPYNVTKITATQNGKEIELIPFAEWDETTDDATSKRPFWLYNVENQNYVPARSIKANVPYLISIPNDADAYDAFYNVNGKVTFYGEEVAVTQLKEFEYSIYMLKPNFNGHQSGGNMMGLNKAGNTWESGGTIPSFHLYASVRIVGNGPQYLPIFDNATGIKETLSGPTTLTKGIVIYNVAGGIAIESVKAADIAIYTISGAQMKSIQVAEGRNTIALPAGNYVINGTKVTVY